MWKLQGNYVHYKTKRNLEYEKTTHGGWCDYNFIRLNYLLDFFRPFFFLHVIEIIFLAPINGPKQNSLQQGKNSMHNIQIIIRRKQHFSISNWCHLISKIRARSIKLEMKKKRNKNETKIENLFHILSKLVLITARVTNEIELNNRNNSNNKRK